MTLQAALDAMTTDAKAWDGVSTELSDSSTDANGLDIAFMSWPQVIGDVPLSSTYNSLQTKVVDLLSGGATETASIADTLIEVRNAYQDSDGSSAADLHGTWDPVR